VVAEQVAPLHVDEADPPVRAEHQENVTGMVGREGQVMT
jgi:hypothetical protein